MEQVYTPNYLIGARPGYCLGYVDDAGKAPARTANAKIAFENEQKAGRIRGDDLPDGVWVVVFFSFTKGGYWYKDANGKDVYLYFKDLGHVALAKRTGNKVVIYDSEVQSGMRGQPYPDIQAVEAWFKAYGAKYIGWSTHCDGREYAKQRSKIMTEAEAKDMQNVLRVLNSEAKGWDRTKTHNGDYDKKEVEYLMSLGKKPSIAIQMYAQQAWNEGTEYRKKKDKWQKDSEVNLPAANEEIKKLQAKIKELESQGSGEFVKISDIYVKKG